MNDTKEILGKYHPPAAKRFGQPDGNKRGRGFWRKEDTPRWKLEQLLKLTEADLQDVADDPEWAVFERRAATTILEGDWGKLERIINQVYGTPKQTTEITASVQQRPYEGLTIDEIRKLIPE